MFSTINFAYAENSGIFIGAGIGSGGVKTSTERIIPYATNTGNTFIIHLDRQTRNAWILNHTFDWGFIAGYKHFFSQNAGARIYGNLNLSHINLSDSSDEIFSSARLLINYTINADFLYNFYSNDSFQAGAFVGLGLGGISSLQTYQLLFHSSVTDFDIGLNIGLRANVFDNHGVEFAVYVPFLPFNKEEYAYKKTTYRHAFTMMARYVYSFDLTKKQTIKRNTKAKNRRIQTKQSPKNIKQPTNNNNTHYDEYDVYYN